MVRVPFPSPSANVRHPLPGSLVQPGHLIDEFRPIAMLEVEKRVEAPVQVVGEIGDLAPQLVLRVPD